MPRRACRDIARQRWREVRWDIPRRTRAECTGAGLRRARRDIMRPWWRSARWDIVRQSFPEHAGKHPGGSARGMLGYSESGGAGRRARPGLRVRSDAGVAAAGPCLGLRVPLPSCGPWRHSTDRRHRPWVLGLWDPQPGGCLGNTRARGVSVAGRPPGLGPSAASGSPPGLRGSAAVPQDSTSPRQGGFTSWGSGPPHPLALGIYVLGFVPPPRLFLGSRVALTDLHFLN